MPIFRTEIRNIYTQGYVPTTLFDDTIGLTIYLDFLRDFHCYLHWPSLKAVYIPIVLLHDAVTSVRGISTALNESVWPAKTGRSRCPQGGALGSAEFDPHNHEAECNSNDRTCRIDEYDGNRQVGKINDQGCECESTE